jgi:uncharacterized membrane protein YkvA (DUF1232 family)
VTLRSRLKNLAGEVHALVLALADKRTPWIARIVGGLTVAYAASPIDLIPDFIPVLGYLDDLVIVPFGIWLTIRLIPKEVWENAHKRVQDGEPFPRRYGVVGAGIVVTLWIVSILVIALLLRKIIWPVSK